MQLGLPNSVMMAALDEEMNILITWSDQSPALAQEIARSGFVLQFTILLQAGSYVCTTAKVSC